MLPTPLTPPNEHAGPYGLEVEAHSAFESYSAQQLATPLSHANMGLEDKSELDDRLESQDVSDEDQDMSDGGAVLAMSLSHSNNVNAEADLIDVEIMGPENLADLMMDNHFPPTLEDAFPDPGSPSNQGPPSPGVSYQPNPMLHPNYSNPIFGDMYMQGGGSNTSLPATMSAVSLQLLHLQNGQEHAGSDDAEDEPHYVNNSTPSILLPYFLSMGVDNANVGTAPGAGPQSDYVSLAEIVPGHGNNSPVSGGLQTAPHLWSTEGSTPSPALEIVVPPSSQQSLFTTPVVDLTLHGNGQPPFISFDSLPDTGSEADPDEVQDSTNFSLEEFLLHWATSSPQQYGESKKWRGPSLPSLQRQRYEKLQPMERADLQGERCDIQRINWKDLGVTRSEAKQARRRTYKNYANMRNTDHYFPRRNGTQLDDDQNFFRFRKMDFSHDIHLAHFQLRNLMACASRDHIFYAGKSKVFQWNPYNNKGAVQPTVAMDLTDPIVQPFHSFPGGIQISTLTVAHDILVAGGFCGEYSLMNLRSSKDTKHTEGLITDHVNSITNHVQVHASRGSSFPVAAFASNDSGLRILDINSNKFIAEHRYDHAINCTAVSPDQRLRVLVGDTRQVMICNAETGEVLQSLEGHRDYGFACDWADDGCTVATGNQDMLVKIWDARKWTNSAGVALPIATIAADIAGVRKLKFSPLGSGKRVLVAAEPADIISIIDGETFTGKQTLSFFGEIGGVDFTNDGQDLIVANCDGMRGGLMEFERCDFASGGVYGLEEYKESRYRVRAQKGHEGYDWIGSDEEVVGHPKSRGTGEQRRRKPGGLGINMGYF